MKKIIFTFLVMSLFIIDVNAFDTLPAEVKLIKCEDATSYWVKFDNKTTHVKLLATDTSDGELNTTIDNYVCSLLEDASKIEILFDYHSLELDDYNRYNVWVYVDGKLLQETLIEKGYAQVNYVKGAYEFLDELCDKQKGAINSKLGIWNYPDQDEKYCQSGINIDAKASNEIKKENQVSDSDYTYLYDMIAIILFIITLSMTLRFKRSRNG